MAPPPSSVSVMRNLNRLQVMWCCCVTMVFLWNEMKGAQAAAAPAAAAAVVAAPGNISKVDDAQYFHIYYGQNFKVIKNSVDGKSYLLMQNNSRMATRTKYCTSRIKSFVIPLANYSADTTDFPVSFLELLGMSEGLKAVTTDAVASPCILKSMTAGGIAVVNKTDSSSKLLQQFIAHFASGVDQNCNYVAFAPLLEETPLQRAEWIKYLGTFGNAEFRANAVYDAVKSNYLCLTKMAANLTAPSKMKPVVAWVEYNQGIWSFARESYKKQFVSDAGGESIDDTIINNTYNVSVPDDMDNFHAILCTVDIVIDQTYAPQPADYALSTFRANLDVAVGDNSCFLFLTSQSLWRYDKRARDAKALDWFNEGVTQPQLVLADLIEVFFPTGNYTTTFFRNIAKGEPVTLIDPAACDRNSSTPLEPTIVPCR